ncbi:putative NAD(P)-binding domain, NAD(P)-binding domain superfamily [Helianthus anomalus]
MCGFVMIKALRCQLDLMFVLEKERRNLLACAFHIPEECYLDLSNMLYSLAIMSFVVDLTLSSPNLKFVKWDIGSADLVNYLLITESIDTIMHFAAQTHINKSFGNSFEFTKNNIYGTHVLLEACKVTGPIRRFIHVSTDEVYGETEEDAIVGNHEASQLLPTNPY